MNQDGLIPGESQALALKPLAYYPSIFQLFK